LVRDITDHLRFAPTATTGITLRLARPTATTVLTTSRVACLSVQDRGSTVSTAGPGTGAVGADGDFIAVGTMMDGVTVSSVGTVDFAASSMAVEVFTGMAASMVEVVSTDVVNFTLVDPGKTPKLPAMF